MPNPTCPANCDFSIPPVKFNQCAPVIVLSEIERIFIAKSSAAPFTNWKLAAEWISRISDTSTVGNNYIRALTVIGDKPAATDVTRPISNGRVIVVGKDHVINFTIDEVSDENYELMRALECGGEFRFWFETKGGKMYGGNSGFKARVTMNDVLNRGVDEIETIAGVISWRTRFSPERADSPIFEGDDESVEIPETFDTVFVFDADATPVAAAGITPTAPAVDVEQQFEANEILPLDGTPISMSITVGGVEELVVDTVSNYLGQYFKYTDKAGVVHFGTFTNGTVAF